MLKRLAVIAALLPSVAVAAPWTLDPSTTVAVDVDWKDSAVVVKFPTISGTVDFDQNAPSGARATIEVATRDATTGVGIVDMVLRSADYLGAEKYPEITFQLDKLIQTSKSTAKVVGRITMRGVTQPASFDATVFRFGPSKADPKLFEAGFDLTGSLDRTQFGSTGGVPEVASVLPVRIHLLMTSN